MRKVFEEYYQRAQEIAQMIFDQPELGYREEATSALVKAEIARFGADLVIEEFAGTGLKVRLNQQEKEETFAFVAELDAVYVPSHFAADPETGAAHACGHFTQTTVALALIQAFLRTESWQQFPTNLVFIFVPAEEYVDLAYREQLREQGAISYYGGKPEAMKLGVFDDVDWAVCIHAIGEEFTERTLELNCDLAGFAYKYYDFYGEPAHAGFDPFSGINAYSISTLFNVALGLQRQQIKDTELIRMNPVVMDQKMSTNVIPDHIRVGTDLRYMNQEYAKTVLQRMDQAAQGSASALGGRVAITTEIGYLPFQQDRAMNQVAFEVYENYPDISAIITDRGAIAAAGDIGDLAFMCPAIQISHGGFTGSIHGTNFQLIDPEFVLKILPDYLFTTLHALAEKRATLPRYRRSYQEYAEFIQTIGETS